MTLSIAPMQWTGLADLHDVPPVDGSDLDCLAEIRDILARHGKLRRFAVHLAHRHFALGPDEILIERPDPDGRTQAYRRRPPFGRTRRAAHYMAVRTGPRTPVIERRLLRLRLRSQSDLGLCPAWQKQVARRRLPEGRGCAEATHRGREWPSMSAAFPLRVTTNTTGGARYALSPS